MPLLACGVFETEPPREESPVKQESQDLVRELRLFACAAASLFQLRVRVEREPVVDHLAEQQQARALLLRLGQGLQHAFE